MGFMVYSALACAGIAVSRTCKPENPLTKFWSSSAEKRQDLPPTLQGVIISLSLSLSAANTAHSP